MVSCEVCHKTFSSKQTVKLHKDAVHEGVVLRCKVCSKAISIGNITHHMKAMHGTETFTCSECNYTTKTKRALTVHNGKFHSEKKFSCKYCDFKGGYQHIINKHLRTSHIKQLTLEEQKIINIKFCKYCDHKANQSAQMKNHMIAKHMKQMTQEELVSINMVIQKCNQCDYETYRSEYLKNHLETHKKKLCCKHCGFEAYSRTNLIDHLKMKHSAKVYYCKSCTFSSIYVASYHKHISGAHVNSENIYKCELCKHESLSLAKLKAHYSNVHKNQEIFECKLCNYSSKHSRAFLRHIERVHHLKTDTISIKNEKTCSSCGSKPKTARLFQLHLYWKHSDKDVGKEVTTKEVKYTIERRTSVTMSATPENDEYFEPKEEEQISELEVDDPGEADEDSILQEEKNEISDDEEEMLDAEQIVKLEPKVELTEDIKHDISDDEMEDQEVNNRQDISNVSSELQRSVQYLCPISYCSFSISDNDKNKRLSHFLSRHKSIDSNCLNFIRL